MVSYIENTQIIEKRDEIYNLTGKENYWLFSAGKVKDLYDRFKEEEIVGIAWDKITLDFIIQNTKDELIDKLKYEYRHLEREYDTDKGFNQYISSVAGKLYRYVKEIKEGDIVVIKNRGKNKILYGRIISEAKVYTKDDLVISSKEGKCNKIRKVIWYKESDIRNIPAELKIAIGVRHAVSKLSGKAKEEINRQIFSYFYRGDKLHMVFYVQETENIKFDNFIEFQNEVMKIKTKYLEEKGVEHSEFNIKTNVQSPGPLEFFGDPDFIKYLYSVLIAGGISAGVIAKLKLKKPNKDINDGFNHHG